MPNNLFNFPMYMKEPNQPGAYGNPLAGLMDDKEDAQQASQGRPSPFRLLNPQYTPMQGDKRKAKNKRNLEDLEMPEIGGVPSFKAIRENPNEVRT